MKARTRRTRHELQSQLQSVLCMAHKEVQRHRRIVSQKRGAEVDWNVAEQDWLQRHFPRWKRVHWNRALVESLVSSAVEVARN